MNKWKPIEGTFCIGIGHRCRQGKDTAANYIIKQFGGEKFSFAKPLYHVARVEHGMKEKDPRLLQILGTEVYRHTRGENIWIDTTYYDILDSRPAIAIFPDVRFENEAKMVTDMGGILIKVTRLNKDGSVFVSLDRDPNHPSEASLNDFKGWTFDLKIKDGDIAGLNGEIGKIMESLIAVDKIII